MIHWTQVINCLTEGGETEALAALNRQDIARLNDVIFMFTRFIKCVEGDFISYCDRFPMWQKSRVNLRSLGANKHAETLTQAVSARFSRTTDLNVIFVCFLVASAGKQYWGAIERPSPFAISMEAMSQQGINTLVKVFSYDVAEMIRLLQDYLYNPRQFDSVKDLYSNCPQFMSIAGQQLDTRSLIDLFIFIG
jgi:hypothetical protein